MQVASNGNVRGGLQRTGGCVGSCDNSLVSTLFFSWLLFRAQKWKLFHPRYGMAGKEVTYLVMWESESEENLDCKGQHILFSSNYLSWMLKSSIYLTREVQINLHTCILLCMKLDAESVWKKLQSLEGAPSPGDGGEGGGAIICSLHLKSAWIRNNWVSFYFTLEIWIFIYTVIADNAYG